MRLAALAFTAVLFASCGFPPDPNPGDYYSVEELEAMPEAQLVYPGATVLGLRTTPRSVHIDGANDAVVDAGFGSDDPHDVILAWYHSELGARGWRVGIRGLVSTELASQQWTKPGLMFRVGVDRKDPDDPRLLSPDVQARFTTTFHTALFASEPLDDEEKKE